MSNVLLVEDSESIRARLGDALTAVGHKVLMAADGVEGLKLAKTRAVHLVVTDLTMPNLDGISLIRALRASREHADTPILVFTTSRGRQFDEALKAGANACELKPFDPVKTMTTIQQLLGRSFEP